MNFDIKETRGEDERGEFVEVSATVGDELVGTKVYNPSPSRIEQARRQVESTIQRKHRPWVTEPDFLELILNGFKCRIHRTEGYGHLCGYIEIPARHPFFCVSYHDDEYRLEEVDIHGGWTYSERGFPYRKEAPEDEGWVIGFDCGHGGDLSPYMIEELEIFPRFRNLNGTINIPSRVYRDIEYVKSELFRATKVLSAYLSAHGRMTLAAERMEAGQ